MKRCRWAGRCVGSFWSDRRASIQIEYVMVLAGFVLPMMVIPFWLMKQMSAYYHFVAKVVGLPFP